MRHYNQMLWRFLGLVLRFAFRRSTVAVDVAQILAASMLPALTKFSGVHTTKDTASNVLAYIGLAAVAFVLLRLISAPYFVWREQECDLIAVRNELARPERLETEYLLAARVRARMKLAGIVRRVYWNACMFTNQEESLADIVKLIGRAGPLMGKADVAVSFNNAYAALWPLARKSLFNRDSVARDLLFDLVDEMLGYLHGRVTADELLQRLPGDEHLTLSSEPP